MIYYIISRASQRNVWPFFMFIYTLRCTQLSASLPLRGITGTVHNVALCGAHERQFISQPGLLLWCMQDLTTTSRLHAPACSGTNGTYGYLANSRSTQELENLFLPSRLLKSILLPGRKACSTMHGTSPSKALPPGSVASTANLRAVIYLLSMALDIGHEERLCGQARKRRAMK